MVHTSALQGRLPGCGCQGAPVGCKPFRGTKLQCRRKTVGKRGDGQTQCAAPVSNVSNVKLPATHQEASQRALDQLRASSSIVNSESEPAISSISRRQHDALTARLCISGDSLLLLCLSWPCTACLYASDFLQDMPWRRRAVS